MGSSTSFFSFMTKDVFNEYIQLTYLSRTEIVYLIKKFTLIDEKTKDPEYRYPVELILEIFPQLKCNPLKDRIFKVFSSMKDEKFSFEDMLDLSSLMSENCPCNVKARWVFEIFDFNEDGLVDKEDIDMAIDTLTHADSSEKAFENKEKGHIISILRKAIDLQGNGGITQMDFELAVGKMPEFPNSFTFRI